MKKRDEITVEDWIAMKKHKRKFEYTPDEMSELFNLVRLYIDPRQATCVTCNTNLREAKTKLNEYVANLEPEIDSIWRKQILSDVDIIEDAKQESVNDQEFSDKPITFEDAVAQTESYSENKKTEQPEEEPKKRGRKKKTD